MGSGEGLGGGAGEGKKKLKKKPSWTRWEGLGVRSDSKNHDLVK